MKWFDFPSKKLSYGWYIVITLAITETISWGIIYYAFSVFITPMEADFGWSRGQLTAGFSLMLLVSGIMAFPVGAWIDKHGARFLMTAGSILASMLIMAWSRVTDLTAFYLIQASLGVCAAMVLYEPAFTVIAKWFHQKRGTALAVVSFAAGFASTIFLPLSDWLLSQFGWREAVWYLGILLAVTTVPLHALVIRRPSEDRQTVVNAAGSDRTATSMSLSAALKSRLFWLLTLAFGLSYLSADAIRVHFIPFLIDNGIEAGHAAAASGAIGVMQVVGRVFFAPVESRVSQQWLVGGIFGLQAIAMLILLPGVSSLVMVGLFIIIFGMAYGARTLARPAVVADLFGVTYYGRISSSMSFFLTVAAMIAPAGAGLLYDWTGNYDLVISLGVLLALLATLCIVLSGRVFRQHAAANESATEQ